jgi:hypothetical protein
MAAEGTAQLNEPLRNLRCDGVERASKGVGRHDYDSSCRLSIPDCKFAKVPILGEKNAALSVGDFENLGVASAGRGLTNPGHVMSLISKPSHEMSDKVLVGKEAHYSAASIFSVDM